MDPEPHWRNVAPFRRPRRLAGSTPPTSGHAAFTTRLCPLIVYLSTPLTIASCVFSPGCPHAHAIRTLRNTAAKTGNTPTGGQDGRVYFQVQRADLVQERDQDLDFGFGRRCSSRRRSAAADYLCEQDNAGKTTLLYRLKVRPNQSGHDTGDR